MLPASFLSSQLLTALQTLLKLCQDNINAGIVLDDARELQKVADTFFTGSTKKNTLKGLESYYGAIKQSASGIANHHEKQQFLGNRIL